MVKLRITEENGKKKILFNDVDITGNVIKYGIEGNRFTVVTLVLGDINIEDEENLR